MICVLSSSSLIKTVLVPVVLLTAVAYTVLAGAQVVGHMQNRWGPTRVGPFGLLQPLADGVKFLFKEDLTPPHVYKPLYIAAPMIAVVFALTSIAVVPIRQSDMLGTCGIPICQIYRRQHRPADHSGRHLDRRLRRRAGGLVVEQQVFPARRAARQRADGQLRDFAGALAGRRADAEPAASACATSWTRRAESSGDSFRAGTFLAASSSPSSFI